MLLHITQHKLMFYKQQSDKVKVKVKVTLEQAT